MKRLAIYLGLALIATAVIAAVSVPTIVESKYNRVRNPPPYPVSESIARLQNELFIADLHADSLLWGRNLLRRSTTGHVDIPRLQQAKVSLQAFTVVARTLSGTTITRV